jgi:hypothetical protein
MRQWDLPRFFQSVIAEEFMIAAISLGVRYPGIAVNRSPYCASGRAAILAAAFSGFGNQCVDAIGRDRSEL